MKHKTFTFLLAALALLLVSACAQSTSNKTVYIGSVQVTCEGVAPQQCLLYKENPKDEYTYLYDGIEGFEYEAGFTYELVITEESVNDPPADGSSFKRTLVEVVSKTLAELPEELSGTSWQLVSLNGNAPIDGSEISLSFSAAEINGNAGCNQYFGIAAVDGSRLYTGMMGTTLMACDEDIDQQELSYLEALRFAQSYSLDDGQLSIETRSGELVFEAQ